MVCNKMDEIRCQGGWSKHTEAAWMWSAWLESNGCAWWFWMLPPSAMFGDGGIIKSLANMVKNARTSRHARNRPGQGAWGRSAAPSLEDLAGRRRKRFELVMMGAETAWQAAERAASRHGSHNLAGQAGWCDEWMCRGREGGGWRVVPCQVHVVCAGGLCGGPRGARRGTTRDERREGWGLGRRREAEEGP